MAMRFRLLICILAAFLLLVPAAGAQDSASPIEPASADMMDPLANISYPPPVYVVRDSVDIRGTADLPGLRTLYIEFRELDLGMMAGEGESQWFPATLPRIAAVVDDVLGTWNTASLPDGLYELQLMVNTGEAAQPVARVSPIRIENNPPEHAMVMMPAEAASDMDEMTDDMPDDMPEEPADDMTDDMPEDSMDDMTDDMADEPVDDVPQYAGPYIEVTVPGANVRSGDSTAYPLVGLLLEGNTAPIKGISAWNTGWWYIELPNGRTGFIAPFIVNAIGETSAVPAIQPPPLPPTPVPTIAPPPPAPVAPPAPENGPNLGIDGSPFVSPHPATCNQTYTIRVRVKNIGTARSGGGLIEIVDSRRDGAGREVTYTPFRQLDPGQSADSEAKITPKVHHSELHHINLNVDYDNRVAETNENDNRAAAAPYILQKGGC
ncbi:MAG: hypothetical protein F4063_10220 [Chloroflexi bacterium]|nr:hypothetical protein [Chloroflexota bacterium]